MGDTLLSFFTQILRCRVHRLKVVAKDDGVFCPRGRFLHIKAANCDGYLTVIKRHTNKV